MANVLVVDDEAGIRRTTALFLEGAGYRVATAASVEEARAQLDLHDVDVVLSDILMPGEDGLRLLEAVRQKSERIRVILITGEPTLETATEALRLGAFDYLPKPATRVTLLAAVERACKAKQVLDENVRLTAENERYRTTLEQLVETRTAQLSESEQRYRCSAERLGDALRGTVGAVATAVESRDPYTAGHQKRVADLAARIARELGLSETAVEGVAMGAAVHDVGKISVPADILSKPRRLTEVEFGLVQQHCEAGRAIFADVDFPWPVADIILQHHERMDGSGYPVGLRGDAIAIEARVVAVADVVEAMASHRPYRPALGVDAALDQLQADSGRLYDADVVGACVRLFRDKGYELVRP